MKSLLLMLCALFAPLILISQEISLTNSANEFIFIKSELPTAKSKIKFYENIKANCYCVVSYNDLTNEQSRSGVCLDLTGNVGLSFSGVNQQSTSKQRKCSERCSEEASSLSTAQLQAIANCACSAGKTTGTSLKAYSALGNKKYSSAHVVGLLENVPAQNETTCTCPNGWIVDNGQTDPNRRCKRELCNVEQPISNRELPNLPGYVWNNVLFQWIAGNCTTTEISPARCRLN